RQCVRRGHLLHLELPFHRFVAAEAADVEGLVDVGVEDGAAEVVHGADPLAGDVGDHVVALHAGAVGGAGGDDVGEGNPLGGRPAQFTGGAGGELAEVDADPAAAAVAEGQDVFEAALDAVHGDGEAKALAAGVDGGVHADDDAVRVHQRPAGVAGVDG